MLPVQVDVAIIGAGTAGMGAYRAARAQTDCVCMTVTSRLEMPFYHPVIEEGVRTALRDLNHQLKIGSGGIKHCMDCGPGA